MMIEQAVQWANLGYRRMESSNGVPVIMQVIQEAKGLQQVDEQLVAILRLALTNESIFEVEMLKNVGTPNHVLEAVSILSKATDYPTKEHMEALWANPLAAAVAKHVMAAPDTTLRLPKKLKPKSVTAPAWKEDEISSLLRLMESLFGRSKSQPEYESSTDDFIYGYQHHWKCSLSESQQKAIETALYNRVAVIQGEDLSSLALVMHVIMERIKDDVQSITMYNESEDAEKIAQMIDQFPVSVTEGPHMYDKVLIYEPDAGQASELLAMLKERIEGRYTFHIIFVGSTNSALLNELANVFPHARV